MAAQWKAAIALVVLIIVGAAVWFGFTTWLAQHDRSLRMEMTLQQKDAEIQQLQNGIAARDKQAAEQIAERRQRAAQVQTPEQAVAALPDVTTLPLSVHQVGANYEIAGPSMVALYRQLETCREDQIMLGTCQTNYADLQKIADDRKVQLDSAVATARGGKWYQRLWRRSKDIGIGVVIGGSIVGGVLAAKR
jgi:hypothetical protein